MRRAARPSKKAKKDFVQLKSLSAGKWVCRSRPSRKGRIKVAKASFMDFSGSLLRSLPNILVASVTHWRSVVRPWVLLWTDA